MNRERSLNDNMGIRIDTNYKPNNIFDLNKEYFDFIHLLDTYKKYVQPKDIVVEVGASTKTRTLWISKYCKKLIAVEYSSQRLCDDFNNVGYLNCDWQKLSNYIEKETVDILISSQCLEHIPNDLAAINETYDVLKKGGIAILNTPNRERLSRAIIEKFTGHRKFPYWEHFREYTKSDLIELIQNSKFINYKIEAIAIGIIAEKHFCIKRCPKIFENLCIHWEITLIK